MTLCWFMRIPVRLLVATLGITKPNVCIPFAEGNRKKSDGGDSAQSTESVRKPQPQEALQSGSQLDRQPSMIAQTVQFLSKVNFCYQADDFVTLYVR